MIRKGTAMTNLDPAFITAVAALLSSLASLVWALRSQRSNDDSR
jgi:hypothetical protein